MNILKLGFWFTLGIATLALILALVRTFRGADFIEGALIVLYAGIFVVFAMMFQIKMMLERMENKNETR